MIRAYLKRLEERGYSLSMIEHSQNYVGRFREFLGLQGKGILHASPKEVLDFILKLRATLSPKTLQLALTMIRNFFEYLRREGKILQNPAEGIPYLGPRHRKLPRDIPDEKTMEHFLDLPDPGRPDGARDKAALELLYGSALRNKELRDLRLSDVDLKNRAVRVRHGKGQKGRMVPMGAQAAFAIQRYLETIRPRHLKIPEETHLFLTERGGPLKEFNVRFIVIRYRKASEKTKRMTAHTLRHACALHMLRGGAPIQAIQELLGHKRLSTTQIYTRLYPKDLKDSHDKHHPRARMKVL